MKFKVSAILPSSANTYFVERDSAAFRSLVAQMCKLESLEIGNSWMNGDTEVYEFVTKPNIERYVPHQFKHFLPHGDLHYTDVIEYDPKMIAQSPYRMRVHSIPPIFASKASIESWLTIEEVTPDSCRQTLEGAIEIKILGLGHVAERIVVDNLKGVYKGIPKIVERWVQFRNEVLKQPEGKDILVKGRPLNSGVEWINDQIRDLVKAVDSESDMNSIPSSSSSQNGHSQLPSVEEMMEDCSIDGSGTTSEDAEDEEEIFFDARETASWADLSKFIGKDASLEGTLKKDTRDATTLLTSFRKSGRRLKKVEVDLPSGRTTGEGRTGEAPTHRFSKDYNEELQEWRTVWAELEVPEARHVTHLRTRLANLLRIGAAVGMFKHSKKKDSCSAPHAKQRKKKKKGKLLAHIDSNTSTGTDGASQEHAVESTHSSATSAATRSEDKDALDSHGSSNSKHSEKKGHRRSRSATFIKDLFTRGGKHEKEESNRHV